MATPIFPSPQVVSITNLLCVSSDCSFWILHVTGLIQYMASFTCNKFFMTSTS